VTVDRGMPVDRLSEAIHQIWFPPPPRWPEPKTPKPEPLPPLAPEQQPEAVIEQVLEKYKVSRAALESHVRWSPVREARTEVIVSLHQISRLSSSDIAPLVGRSVSSVNDVLRQYRVVSHFARM